MADYCKGCKKRLTPLQGKEAADEGTATGIGGERRRRTIDSIVDDAESGESDRKRRNQSTDHQNRY
jgi:hypothetical protein